MKTLLRNLLPNDTRVAELASAIALCLFGAVTALSRSVPTELLAIQPYHFWAVASLALGTLQLASVLCYDELDLLRCYSALFNGSVWIWIAIVEFMAGGTPDDFATLFVGVANMYAFSISLLSLKTQWEN